MINNSVLLWDSRFFYRNLIPFERFTPPSWMAAGNSHRVDIAPSAQMKLSSSVKLQFEYMYGLLNFQIRNIKHNARLVGYFFCHAQSELAWSVRVLELRKKNGRELIGEALSKLTYVI